MKFSEERKIDDFKHFSLYINSTGYAYLEFWPSRRRKYLLPNEKGYIFVYGKKINLKREIYEKIYPRFDLSDKIVIKIGGQTFNINNLFALTKNEFRNFKKYDLEITKNEKTGHCFFKNTTRGRNF